MNIFKLPDLGEGLPDAEIREWHVKVGDHISADQPLVSMETAKAVVEVPSPQTGKILKLFGVEGDTIDTGCALVEFALESIGAANAKQQLKPEQKTEKKSDKSSTVAGKIEESDEILDEENFITPNRNTSTSPNANLIKATPAVRALAQKLGVDLNKVRPTGVNNIITSNDVKSFNSNKSNQIDLGDDAEPLKGVRKAMAAAMTQAHNEVAPASLFDEADVFNWQGKQDITARLIRALITACKAEPSLNALYDSYNNTRKVSDNIHLGLAVDTKEGLFVPVLKNIEQVTPSSLRDLIDRVKTKIINRTMEQENLKGNTITLSNIGTVAGKFACPIVVPPTVAIIAIGKIYNTVCLNNNNQVENHKTIPVSLTFDHRCVTGGEAARFLKEFINNLEQIE